MEMADFALIDARSPEQYSGDEPGAGISRPGHIPGAVNIPWSAALESKQDPRLLPIPDLRKIFRAARITAPRLIVYCRTGMLASFLYFTARFLGYDAVMYDGSFFEWSNSSVNAVQRGPSPR